MDQTAKDIFSAGMQIKGMRDRMDQLELSKKRQAIFDQQQKEREIQIMARQEVANAYQKSGIIDENGNITDQGYQAFLNPQASDKNAAVDALKEKGKYAYGYMKAQTEFTGQLLANETNKRNLHMLAFNRADETYNNIITPNLKAAEISAKRGDKNMAAQSIANAIMGANHRVRAKAVGDKIETWQVVNGERQPSHTMNIEEAFALAKDYTRENYVSQAAAEIVAGYEHNSQPKTFNLKDPKGKDFRAVQVFKSDSTVDYLFFNKDGSVAKDAPNDLEKAYQNGWTQVTAEGQKAADESRYKGAQTAKIEKETDQIGKEKPVKPEKDKTTEDRQKMGEKRMKYIDDAMATFDETNPEANPEDRKAAEKQAEKRFNEEVMGWTPVGKNKKTAEIMYQTPDGEMVNKYGRPMKPMSKKKSQKPTRTEGKEKFYRMPKR